MLAGKALNDGILSVCVYYQNRVQDETSKVSAVTQEDFFCIAYIVLSILHPVYVRVLSFCNKGLFINDVIFLGGGRGGKLKDDEHYIK